MTSRMTARTSLAVFCMVCSALQLISFRTIWVCSACMRQALIIVRVDEFIEKVIRTVMLQDIWFMLNGSASEHIRVPFRQAWENGRSFNVDY